MKKGNTYKVAVAGYRDDSEGTFTYYANYLPPANNNLADARTALRELRVRKRIDETTTPIEQLDQPHFRWVRPSA